MDRLWLTNDRSDLSSERAPQTDRALTFQPRMNIWSWAPGAARHQDRLTDRQSQCDSDSDSDSEQTTLWVGTLFSTRHITTYRTEQIHSSGNTSDLYSGVAWFESRSACQLLWRFLYFSSFPSGKCCYIYIYYLFAAVLRICHSSLE
jgi:hypothetical protein